MKIINDLKTLSIEDYDKCLCHIVDSLSKNKDIISIFQFGNVGFPGISDLDLLFVVDDYCRYSEVYAEINAAIEKSPNSSYCLYHPAIVVTHRQSQYLYLFHHQYFHKILYRRHRTQSTAQ